MIAVMESHKINSAFDVQGQHYARLLGRLTSVCNRANYSLIFKKQKFAQIGRLTRAVMRWELYVLKELKNVGRARIFLCFEWLSFC